jgi:hypothetical protein
MVVAELVKHSERMQLPDRQSDWFVKTVALTTNRLLQANKFAFDFELNDQVAGVSIKASVGSSRADGGNAGYFRKGRDLWELPAKDVEETCPGGFVHRVRKKDYYFSGTNEPLVVYLGTQSGEIHMRIYPGQVRPVCRQYRVDQSGDCESLTTWVSETLPTTEECLRDLFLNHRDVRRNVVGICEPLKVRIVTTHLPSEQPLWERFARYFQSWLENFEWVLSGKEVNEDSWKNAQVRSGWVFVSDDADAATDSFGIQLQLEAIISWLSTQPDYIQVAWERTLGGKLSYGLYRDQVPPVRKTTGQLMGDRRSFGMLNLIHLGAKLTFCFLHGYTDDEIFIRVNGDDGVIHLRETDLGAYHQFMSELWSLNNLKTYVNKCIISFNSVLWHLGTQVRRVPIIRFNVLAGIDKFGDPQQDPALFDLVVQDAIVVEKDTLWKWFIGNPHWRDQLARLSHGGNNWFLPKNVGGLGISSRDPEYITHRQMGGVRKFIDGSRQVSTAPIRPKNKVRTHVARNWFHVIGGVDAPSEAPLAVPRTTVENDSVRIRPGKLPKGGVPDFDMPLSEIRTLRRGATPLWPSDIAIQTNESPNQEVREF